MRRSCNTDLHLDVAIIGASHDGLVAAAYLAGAGLSVSLLLQRLIRELRLAEHGLTILPRPMQNFLPLEHGAALRVPVTAPALAAEIARHCPRDAA